MPLEKRIDGLLATRSALWLQPFQRRQDPDPPPPRLEFAGSSPRPPRAPSRLFPSIERRARGEAMKSNEGVLQRIERKPARRVDGSGAVIPRTIIQRLKSMERLYAQIRPEPCRLAIPIAGPFQKYILKQYDACLDGGRGVRLTADHQRP